MQIRFRAFTLAGALLLSVAAGAQQLQTTSQRGGYDPSREITLLGTVVSSTAQSTAAPFGAHVIVQTASGTIDVNLGNAARLKAAGLQLNTGDSIRIVGETINFMGADFFAARLVQNGTQAVALRSSRGIPLAAPRQSSPSASGAKTQGGAR
ncbi:MAG TPA: hypothetical protein VOA78_00390 [Candidatus Dormibacteraeota bacterium]|nr:hypothetical protein [Candidatus Dormibacteraeota bacterium]